jgi:peptide/nickel transport system substrate-binding protein
MSHRSFISCSALVVAVFATVVGPVWHQLAADEEEEAAPKKPTKRVIVLEDDTPTGGANVLGDLVRGEKTATHPTIKKYYATLSIACDRITLESKTLRVLPLPLVWGKDKYPTDGFGIAALDANNKAGEVQSLGLKDVKSISHFEPLVLTETERLLKDNSADAPTESIRLEAAERVLTAALFFHDSAIDSGRRRGKSWEPFKTSIVDRLTEVRLSMVKRTIALKNWDRLREQVARFGERYRNNPAVLQELLAARLHEGVELVKSTKLADLERARDILSDFESKFPNTGNEQAIEGNDAERRNLLRNVESLAPDLSGLREAQKDSKLGFDTLVVGVKRMPRLMSPATAREDSEKMVVELMFEGLLEPTPDPSAGTQYRLGLAAIKPRVNALVRDVSLVGNAEWGRPNSGSFDAADLAETIRLMREKRGIPSAERVDYLDDLALDPSEPGRVKLRFKAGHPDPRELLSFKVLPGKYLAGKNKGIDDDSASESFARIPFGTGPFKLDPAFKPAEGTEPAANVVLVPNPNFWRRPGKIGQPAIKEIRFVNTATMPDAVNEVRGDRLHLISDVPTRELERFKALGKISVETSAVNRRIYMLAVNHASLPLQNLEVRRGLLHAIDREGILNDVYRAGKKEFHKSLTGPYPAGCWQEPQVNGGPPAPLFNRDLAAAKFKQAGGSVKPISLLFANDDQQTIDAVQKIKTQIEDAGGGEVTLEGVTPAVLWTRLEKEGRFDLAYVPFDYPDIYFSHALSAFMDPTASGRGGRNFLSYLVKSTNPSKADEAVGQMLAGVRMHRDYAGDLTRTSRELANRFNEAVPFVPLWQLDRHLVISSKLKIYLDLETNPTATKVLDPIRVFHNAGRWRMDESR